jgi:hypothetical protein
MKKEKDLKSLLKRLISAYATDTSKMDYTLVLHKNGWTMSAIRSIASEDKEVKMLLDTLNEMHVEHLIYMKLTGELDVSDGFVKWNVQRLDKSEEYMSALENKQLQSDIDLLYSDSIIEVGFNED